ncbi:MAG: proline--tRNA ligase [Promethearchaeota archaeon]
MKLLSENEEKLPDQLTFKKSSFSEWYNQLLSLTEIIDKRYDVKGMYVWKSYGLELMKRIQSVWDRIYRESGIEEMYFPQIVPLKYAQMNAKWFEGFQKEVFWVKGFEDDEASHILRPTGEPAMYPLFKLWIRSHTDLPLRIYETVSSFRYETKHTRSLIRDREIAFWYEIHTAHATKEESVQEVEEHLRLNDIIWDHLAVPALKVKKPQWECFPGAEGAIEYYNIMPDGRLLENGSVNNLGQAYAKEFDIKYRDPEGTDYYVWQICTGNGARFLVAAIAQHGDDRGLVIPPKIAPIQVVIVPIIFKDSKNRVITKSKELKKQLEEYNIRVHLDLREESVGSKFYQWELKGIPLRFEIGPKDLEKETYTIYRRDKHEKSTIHQQNALSTTLELLDDIQKTLRKQAETFYSEMIVHVEKSEVLAKITKKKVAQVFWCESGECWDEIKRLEEGIELVGTLLDQQKSGDCIVCETPTNMQGLVARTY